MSAAAAAPEDELHNNKPTTPMAADIFTMKSHFFLVKDMRPIFFNGKL
jgi:hypothetical protein